MSASNKNIQPFLVMEILAMAKELERHGKDVIHLEIGEPDFPTPPLVIQDAKEFLERGRVGYSPAGGLPELRDAIARHYRDRHDIDLSPNRIFVTPGASGAFLLLLGLLGGDGKRVLLTDPGYPCYANLVRLFGGEVAAVPVQPDANFHFTVEQFTANWTESTRGSIVASPSNPTGTIIAPAILDELIGFSHRRNGFLIADEIYHGLEDAGCSPTALTFSDEVFIANSFSKYFGMPGWRVGWAIVPETFQEQAERLAQNLFICAPLPSQHAALAALSPECRAELERRRRTFAERRDFLASSLRDLGFAIPAPPQGALYVYADCSAFTDDSAAFARRILEQTAVAITPGKDFGEHRARHFLRLSCTSPIDRLSIAMDRLRNYLQAAPSAIAP